MRSVLILSQLLQEILAWQRRTMAMMYQRVAAGESSIQKNLLMRIKHFCDLLFSSEEGWQPVQPIQLPGLPVPS
jgi:hypothetical protein